MTQSFISVRDRFDHYKLVRRKEAGRFQSHRPVSAFRARAILERSLLDRNDASHHKLIAFGVEQLGQGNPKGLTAHLRPHMLKALERALDDKQGPYVLLKAPKLSPSGSGPGTVDPPGGDRPERPAVGPVPPTPDPVKSLTLTAVDPHFAPGVDQLSIQYACANVAGDSVRLSVVRQADPTTVLFQRSLTVDEKADGDHTIEWDGRGHSGYLTPQQSPFTVVIQVTGDDSLKGEAPTAVEIHSLEIEAVGATNDKLFMNDPDAKIEIHGTVKLKKKDGSAAVTPVPQKVRYTFTDPAPANTDKTDSFEYSSGLFLGKAGDAAAVHWASRPGSTTTTADGFKTACEVQTTTTAGASLGMAKVDFKPSGVGKDSFKLKGAVLAEDGTTELASQESADLVVWRKIEFNNVYTMDGENYIDAGTVEAEITPAFDPANVQYTRGAVNTLDAALSVKYIGLYDSTEADNQKNWPADFSPANLETAPNQLAPTAAELADYAYAGADLALVAQKAAAKLAIEAKAQAWFNAIVGSYSSCNTAWFAAASVPGGSNALLAVQYYHPKLSNAGDGATNFWPAGITINLANPGSGLNNPGDPDRATWREVQGFNRGKTSVIFKNYGTAARLQIVCRHEIGHGTKSDFHRERFGVGDHSGSQLMTPYGGAATFSARDRKILRGVLP